MSLAFPESAARRVAHTAGESEGLEPIMQDLPAAYHGKEAELYFAGERIRSLPITKAEIARA
ncbi:MAG: hypothetical protein WA021_01470 [Minisyncoccia bacterium]